ncbi:YifB family Mg chelatase-like AAA ATPase [uncultured Jatrophihabitans sp.]|uniref:YifB family Mg chelatase-like AAA ATPase n=1 Tax=uncultured Jatrophihabitans sp. TaxID=1610747 RepID=UPI0035CC55F1
MALARTLAVALAGLDGRVVEVECDIAGGLPGITFTGRADSSVVESRDRLRAAVVNSGIEWPNRKITVALLPADVPKSGARFDVAIAVAVLAAAGQIPTEPITGTAWIAGLGLDGRLRSVTGVLPAVLAARGRHVRRVVVATANAAEAALVTGVDVRVADTLGDIVAALRGDGPPLANGAPVDAEPDRPGAPDLADVAGQIGAKRALEIAAAGGHHLYMVGSPGAGKTMLAERLPGLLPPLSDEAALEVTAVHSVAGLLDEHARLVRRAPMQAPHHTATMAALVGGGANLARPGAISLAHHGVLFLDEASEFAPSSLDALRQPLESGFVVLHRAGGTVRYPARLQLVLATNPCPCARRASECVCVAQAKRRHTQRLSGPLMDRIDLRVQVEPVPRADLIDPAAHRETSTVIAARVASARAAAEQRWRTTRWRLNGEVPGSLLRSAPWLLDRRTLRPVEQWLERGVLSARGFDRVLRLAWTIADLAGRAAPSAQDVSEALFFRTGQVDSWAA